MMEKDDKAGRPHICMIVPQADVKGGIAAVVSGYYGSQLEKDYDITYVESYCDGSRWTKLRKALRAYRQFRKVLRDRRPELVHIHSSFGPSFYRKLPFIRMCWRRGIPVVNHIHGSAFDEFYAKAPAWKQRLVRKIYGECTAFIVLAPEWKKRIGTIVPEDRITVIPNYAAEHPEVQEKAIRDRRWARQQILFLGVITEGKGLREMPAVIKAVSARFPGARFVFCGVGEEDWLRAEVGPELAARLEFPGWVRGEEKDRYLRESTLFWLPSHMEAMPMSALDAMGYGLPVVSTLAGGIPAVVENGKDGVLTAVGDTAAMAEAICRFLSDRTLWERASDACLARVHDAFSLEQHIRSIETVYRKVLHG